MRLLIDALSARYGGNRTYVRELMSALAASPQRPDLSVVLSSAYQSDLRRELSADVDVVPVSVKARNSPHRLWIQQVQVPILVRRYRCDLLLTVSEIATLLPGCPHVVTVHGQNLYAKWRVDGHFNWYRLARWPLAVASLRSADRAVFVSASLAHEVDRFRSLRSVRKAVVHHGVDSVYSPVDGAMDADVLGGFGLDQRPYLLAVSTIGAHKGYETLLRGFALAQSALGDVDMVIVGIVADEPTFLALQALAEELGIGRRVRFLGWVQDPALPILYRHARTFVFPSRREGFGLPLLEAMASGVPVVCSSIPVFKEIASDAALFFTTDDCVDLAKHLEAANEAGPLRETLMANGLRRASGFRWGDVAVAMQRVFDEIMAHATNE